ncbi:MAG: Ig-like domain-containing protein [Myxococcales bacterium]|nr:Ig-like domain-containing protein [Myxococcales bacterium]MCB9534940.1 Ig-like domain-containing protein [Myxococcales bacterium]
MRTQSSMIWLAAALVVAPLALLAGCDDNAAKPDHREVLTEQDPDRTPTPGGDNRPEFDDAGNLLPPQTFGRILVIAGDDEKDVHVGGQVELAVLLLDTDGNPVSDDRVEFAIVDEDAPQGVSLSARRTVTDANGLASVDFQAGMEVRDFTVEAWSPDTRRLQFTVHVRDLPAGDVEVAFDYEGPVPLGQLEVYLLTDDTFCEDPYYLTRPEGEAEVLHSAQVEHHSDRLLVENILAGTRFSVLVRGRTATNGVLAAGGCAGDLVVRADEVRRVRVSVFLLPLNPAGTYTLINHFDFTDAIPGTLGDVIRALVRFFGDQNHEREIAGLVFDLVEGLVREAAGAIGALVVDLVRGWVEDDLNDIINDYIDNDGPDWLRSFFTVGSDIISVVSNMEVISKMRLSKPRRDGTFDGSQNWIGMAFYWRLPCQNDPDPECGRYAFTMDEVAAAAEGIQLVFGQFSGRIHTYNQGIIDSHTMDLQYGRLIIFVLNNIVLPFIADGADNLHDALLNLANCPGFANGITGGNSHLRLGGINIVSRNTIEGWCTTVLGVAGDAAEAIIGRLRIDTRLTLQGEMQFVEENDDLTVDAIEEGVWRGIIRTSNDEGPPFDGDFAGPMDGAMNEGEEMEGGASP